MERLRAEMQSDEKGRGAPAEAELQPSREELERTICAELIASRAVHEGLRMAG